MLLKYLKIITLLSLTIFIFACKSNITNKQIKSDTNIVATIEKDTVSLFEIDSTISQQIYNIRMQYLEVLISRKILEIEAKKQGIKIEELIKDKINTLAKKVNNNDISNYIKREKIAYIDTASIVQYLTMLKRKQRQKDYTDSLKEHININVLLIPPFF